MNSILNKAHSWAASGARKPQKWNTRFFLIALHVVHTKLKTLLNVLVSCQGLITLICPLDIEIFTCYTIIFLVCVVSH